MPSIPFTIDFTSPAAPTSLAVANTALNFDPTGQYSAHTLTWTPVSTAPENILRIEVWTTDAYEAKRIAWFTEPAVTSFIYYFPRFNTSITYQILQIVKGPGGITQVGLWATLTTSLLNNCLSFVSVLNPVSHRVSFQAWTDFTESLLQSQEWQIPAGGQDYFEVGGSLRGRDINLGVELADRQDGSGITALAHKISLEQLFDAIPPETVCLRHQRGGKWFGRFNGNWNVPYIYGNGRFRASGTFRRTSFKEGN